MANGISLAAVTGNLRRRDLGGQPRLRAKAHLTFPCHVIHYRYILVAFPLRFYPPVRRVRTDFHNLRGRFNTVSGNNISGLGTMADLNRHARTHRSLARSWRHTLAGLATNVATLATLPRIASLRSAFATTVSFRR